MTFSILEVFYLLIISNIGSYLIGKYSKAKGCDHQYFNIGELKSGDKGHGIWLCRKCGNITTENIER